MKTYHCFTLSDFSHDDGGTVRMRGIVNALVKRGDRVVFFSNCADTSTFSPDVTHVFLETKFSKREKQFLQFSLALFPFFVVKVLFGSRIEKLSSRFFATELQQPTQRIFFEYLDNSIAYILYQCQIIPNYTNDIHGVASLEFQFKKTRSLFKKALNSLKFVLSKRLDGKVLSSSKGCIFVSNAMQDYFYKEYPILQTKENFVVRDAANRILCQQHVSAAEISQRRQSLAIHEAEKVIFFAGEFKQLGGVLDLIEAFTCIFSRYQGLKLVLVGDGEAFTEAKQLSRRNRCGERILFTGRIPYQQLKSYQMLADIVVCPDKKNPFSDMVPHIKYFDSLASGKIVVKGRFKCIDEMNKDQSLSVEFEPSNIESLTQTLTYCLDHLQELKKKYQRNAEHVCRDLTYDASVLGFD